MDFSDYFVNFQVSPVSMAENGLVSLAATLKKLLASPHTLVPESKAEHDARLDIIDMIPDLNRTLVGDKQTLRDLAWSVRVSLVTTSSIVPSVPASISTKSHHVRC
jgi:hypothetical protein